jgi:hypothetical protein
MVIGYVDLWMWLHTLDKFIYISTLVVLSSIFMIYASSEATRFGPIIKHKKVTKTNFRYIVMFPYQSINI